MNKTCARCTKVVYPLEELKCLEKSWHKTCFKCTECSMALNMKTYKGFNKFPYCEAHIPKAKATTIADTPELKRIAENTKIQSNVQYHADFEKLKGKVTQVADDPETLRIKQNTKQISNVAYHGDLEKKAAMERQRETNEITESRDKNDEDAEYFSEQLAAEFQSHSNPVMAPPQSQQSSQQPMIKVAQQPPTLSSSMHQHHPQVDQHHHHHHQQQQQQQHNSDYYNNNSGSNQNAQRRVTESAVEQLQRGAPPGHRQMNPAISGAAHPSGGNANMGPEMYQQPQKYFDPYDNYSRPAANPMPMQQPPTRAPSHQNNNHAAVHQQQQIYDRYATNANGLGYDALAMAGYGGGHLTNNGANYAYNNSNGKPMMMMMPPTGVAGHPQQQPYYMGNANNNNYEGGGGTGGGNIGKIADYDPLTDGPRKNIPNVSRPSSTLVYSSVSTANHPNRRIGSINDIDPVNGVYGSVSMEAHQQQQQQQHMVHPQMQQQQARVQKYRIFRAVYDYEAKDVDEVSFLEGDLIYELESIDAGWMTGRVERTGKTGMLPANYLELAKI